MTKRYALLQKKLQELESQLNKIFGLSGEYDHIQIDDFEQRLGFVKSLLAAEIASGPTKPHHLVHMSQRLDELIAYWDCFKTTSFDNSSTCFCTDACLNHDGEVENDDDDNDSPSPVYYEDPPEEIVINSEEDIMFNAKEDKLALVEFGGVDLVDKETTSFNAIEFSDCLVDEKGDDEERVGKRKLGRGGFSGGLASGMVIGMALMGFFMVTFSGCFRYGDQQYASDFLTPT